MHVCMYKRTYAQLLNRYYTEQNLQAAAKFSVERAQQAVEWVEAVIGKKLELPSGQDRLQDQVDFGAILKDGKVLCE